MKIIWKFINGQYLEYLIIFLNPSMLFFKKKSRLFTYFWDEISLYCQGKLE